jgi:hypothetical protein
MIWFFDYPAFFTNCEIISHTWLPTRLARFRFQFTSKPDHDLRNRSKLSAHSITKSWIRSVLKFFIKARDREPFHTVSSSVKHGSDFIFLKEIKFVACKSLSSMRNHHCSSTFIVDTATENAFRVREQRWLRHGHIPWRVSAVVNIVIKQSITSYNVPDKPLLRCLRVLHRSW